MDGVVPVLQVVGVLVDHDCRLPNRLPQSGIGDIDVAWVEVSTLHFAILDRMTVALHVDPRAIVIVIENIGGIPSTVVEF